MVALPRWRKTPLLRSRNDTGREPLAVVVVPSACHESTDRSRVTRVEKRAEPFVSGTSTVKSSAEPSRSSVTISVP